MDWPAYSPGEVGARWRWKVTITVLSEASGLSHVATFCGQCNCGCPEVLLDHGAGAEKRIVISDDFGQRIQMSVEQLRVLVADVKSGVLDAVIDGAVDLART